MLREATIFETRRVFRFFPTIFFTLVFPLMMLVIFGSVFGNESSDLFSSGLGTVDETVPSYMVLVIAVTGLMSFPLTMAEYRDRGVLRRLQTTPVSPRVLLGGQLIVNLALTVAGVGLLVIVGALFFDLTMTANWAAFLPALVVSLVAVFAIGLLVAAWSPNERTATLVANLVYFPMIFLSGATLPAELLPDAIRTAAKVLPTTWAVALARSTWNNVDYADLGLAYAVLIATIVVCGSLATVFFRWD